MKKRFNWVKPFKSILLGITVCGFLLTGCNQSPVSVTNDDIVQNGNIGVSKTVEIGDRQYIVALPYQYDEIKAHKLLLVFHGSGGTAQGMQYSVGLEQLSQEYIVVYPQSKVEEWNDGCECNKTARLGIDDLTFVDDLIADVSSRHLIEQDEIYAAGFSQGGLFAQNLLCNRSETFKAIASVASPMSVQLSASCALPTPTSYMMVHGKKDAVLPFEGMEHRNFGLIPSTDAIALIAQKNGSLPNPLIKQKSHGVELSAYWNGNEKTHLYAIEEGRHEWRYTDFDTSSQILDFFASANTPELPKHSQLVALDEGSLHVRSLGEEKGEKQSKPTVILLSGPNKYFHSDSAWFTEVQRLLAESYKVRAIDRPGNGWSDFDEHTSYANFVDKLYQTLVVLDEQEVIFVTFSSGNATARLFQQKYGDDDKVKLRGMVWIDPDIFLPHSIAMYQDYPVTYYRKNLAQLLPHLQTGAWTERTAKKLVAEREEISVLRAGNTMDWSYYDAISQQRLLIDRQQTRSLEIAHYHDDLNAVANLDFIEEIPVSVIDSDFELGEIARNPDSTPALTQWMDEGTQWSKLVAGKSGGQYIALQNAHHLVPLQSPQVIVDAVDWLLKKN